LHKDEPTDSHELPPSDTPFCARQGISNSMVSTDAPFRSERGGWVGVLMLGWSTGLIAAAVQQVLNDRRTPAQGEASVSLCE